MNKRDLRAIVQSRTDLRRRIERFMEHWNEHPQPFIWTATVESMLAKLKRIAKLIGATPHWESFYELTVWYLVCTMAKDRRPENNNLRHGRIKPN